MSPKELYWAKEYERQVLSGDLTNVLEYEAHESMGSYDAETITETQNRFGYHQHALTFVIDEDTDRKVLICTGDKTYSVRDLTQKP